ncbi:MAG TPA: C39 family peptidase [Nocardioidaceae bacterium]|nr:C39 family peptidase [Nocardioidaceae bacterium]
MVGFRTATTLTATIIAAAGAVPASAPAVEHAPAHAAAKRQIVFERWSGPGLQAGRVNGARVRHGSIVIGPGAVRARYNDPYDHAGPRPYDRGRWTSPWAHTPFGLTELIASYDAKTPVGTFIEIWVRGRSGSGALSSWDSLGRWASHDTRFHRMSLGPQADDLSSVAVDTLTTHQGVRYRAWQLRVDLFRHAGGDATLAVEMVGAMASRVPDRSGAVSRPGSTAGTALAVPRFSQEIHQGEYPQWNGGGEAWCSPTSTSMVLAYWNRGPKPRQYAWVDHRYRQPWVDYAARYTYASGYDGTGMWPFNTAYASRFGLDAFVTRLRSLREAELFISAGIPLVASIAFGKGELDGAPIDSTNGHLLVIRGFTARGDVRVNDPAAPSAKTVARTYRRGQFERAWIGATGGVAYVIHPRSTPLPAPGRHSNW